MAIGISAMAIYISVSIIKDGNDIYVEVIDYWLHQSGETFINSSKTYSDVWSNVLQYMRHLPALDKLRYYNELKLKDFTTFEIPSI